MAEINGEHVCGPLPDPNEPLGTYYTCPDCGLGYFYDRHTGWHVDGLFAGETRHESRS